MDRLILVVTGAHLRSEAGDRPLAYALAEEVRRRLEARGEDNPPTVLVCSDVWYLNNEDLRRFPVVSVGGPGVNALSAYLTGRLPAAFAVEGVLCVQLDLDFVEMSACCWGMDSRTTVPAVEAFIEKYLDVFLEHALRRLEEA